MNDIFKIQIGVLLIFAYAFGIHLIIESFIKENNNYLYSGICLLFILQIIFYFLGRSFEKHKQ